MEQFETSVSTVMSFLNEENFSASSYVSTNKSH